jgi:hypothetical protein
MSQHLVPSPQTKRIKCHPADIPLRSAPLRSALLMTAALFTAAIFIASLLSGCGGTSASSTTTPATLTGTIAAGAPMLNATITVKDVNGLTRTGTAAPDGSYSGIDITGLVAPFSLQACGLVDANYTCFYSLVQQAGIANVTPITNALLALALASDPAGMFAPTTPTPLPSAADMEAQKTRLKSALAALLSKAGLADIDFATTPFSADRTGMDKVLDSVKISTGTDGATNKSFVQLEGIIGAGNVFLDKNAVSGSLTASGDADVDLKGISGIFVQGMSFAIAAADQATCTSRMNAANIFDDAFSLNFDNNNQLSKTNAAQMICQLADINHLLGGVVANPLLRDCDFKTDVNRKICTVGFNIVNGENSFDGAELAIVLRPGADWKLLGRESPYEIHVSAAIQRTSRIDITDNSAPPTYTRALSFDITGNDGSSATGIRAAKVYQRNLDGSGWETTPLVSLSLSDACIAQLQPGEKARLSTGGSCGSSWLSLGDTIDGANAAAAGDALIDNFYKRGRTVKLELFPNIAASGSPIVLIKRVEGVPPKYAALASFPWIEMDSTSKTALLGYDGLSASFNVAWDRNRTVSGKDITFCLAGDCQGNNRGGHEEILNGHTSQAIAMNHKPANAAAYKSVGIYGRNRDQLGVSSNYLSCGGRVSCF